MMLIKTANGSVYGKVDRRKDTKELNGYITVEEAPKAQKVLYKTEDGKVYGVH